MSHNCTKTEKISGLLQPFLHCIVGIASTQGDFWKEQRRFAHTVLRDMGMGKSIIEKKIVEELSFFTERLKELSVSPFDPKMTIQMTVANVIESVVWGKRRNYTDSDFVEFMEIISLDFDLAGSSGLLEMLPFLK